MIMQLTEEASRLGLSLPEYAVRILASACPSVELIRSGAELVSYWQTERLVGCREEITDSQIEARRLREQAQHRRA